VTLQNHLGDREWPVRSRGRWRALVRSAARGGDSRVGRRSFLLFLVPALAVAVGLIATQALWLPLFPNPPADGLGDLIWAIVLLAAFVGFAVQLGVGGLITGRLPAIEQRRYLELTRARPLTPAQQALLALDAPSDFAAGLWNSSLEYQPSWVLLPPEMRAKHRDGEAGQPFTTLPIQPLRSARETLDAQFRVVTADDLELFVADCFTASSWSGRLRHVIADDPRAVARLASLSGLGEFELRDLAVPAGDRPAPLLWGADVQRAIAAIRLAYLAGVVGADRAWELIARAAGIAVAVYGGWSDYWRSLQLARALGSDTLEEVDRTDSALRDLIASEWPAARVPWPPAPPGGVLPPSVLGRWTPADPADPARDRGS